MARHSYLELVWVRGHPNSPGNIAADALAKRGARLRNEEAEMFVGAPMSYRKSWILRTLTSLGQELGDLMLHFQKVMAPI